MKKLALITLGLSIIASSAFAATTITANNRGTTSLESFQILNSSGVAIAQDSGAIALGSFTGDVNIGASTVAEAIANFVQFGESAVFGGIGTIPGLYDRAISGEIGTLAGQTVYTVIGNGSTLASSTDLLIFEHVSSFVAEPGTTDNAIVRDGEAFGQLILGTSGTDGAGQFTNYYQMALIPEPSTALLTSLGAGFLLFRRRR